MKEDTQTPVTDFFSVPGFQAQIQEGVMPLLAKKGEVLVQLGTGFIINENGLMMSAAHVFTEAQKYSTRQVKEGEYYDHVEMYAVLILNQREGLDANQRFGGLVRVQKLWWHKEHDIALCLLEPTKLNSQRFYFPKFTLSPGIPNLGDKIVGFGYPDNRVEMPEESDFIKYFHKNAIATGQIIEIYLEGRDKGMLPFPCFETNARFDGGMSGGPIFNENGHVCGVICSGLPASDEHPEYVSYGSLISTALTIELELAFGENSETEELTLYDLVQRGYVLTDETIKQIGIKLKETKQVETVSDVDFEWF